MPPACGLALAAGGSGTFAAAARLLLAHLAAAVAAGVFVFFSLMGVQTTLVLLLPRRVLRSIAALVQLVFVVGLLEWLVFSPGVLARLGGDEPSLSGLGSLSWLPPLWFLGLYEVLMGAGVASLQKLALSALGATAVSLPLAAVVYGAAYRRLVRALETPEPPPRRSGFGGRIARRVAFATVVRHPTEQAVVAFVAMSLARSRRHRLAIAVYLGVGTAFIIGGFLGPALRGEAISFAEPTVLLLSIPLVLSFFALVALRVLFTVATELGANWVFQLTERDDGRRDRSGVRKAMVLLGLVPIVLVTLPGYLGLWGAKLALTTRSSGCCWRWCSSSSS